MSAVFDHGRPDPEQGLFETLLVVDGRPVELEAHLARLAASLEELFPNRPVPVLDQEIRSRAQEAEHAAIRVVVAPGEGASLSASIQLRPAPDELPAASGRDVPRRMVELRSVEVPGGLGAHKWVDRSLLDAAQAVLSSGSLPLLLDRDGWVLEASRANVFAVRDGALLTPPTDGRILPGITRARLIEIATGAGIEVDEIGLRRADLLGAEAVFLTGSVRGIEPVGRLDGAELGQSEITADLARTLLQTWTAAKVG